MTDIRVRSLAKGLGSFVLPQLRNSHVGPGAVRSAETSYSVFLRYLSSLHRCSNFSLEDAVIAELGPGSSLGFGMAALLSGAKRYYAFDCSDHISPEYDLQVFDRLVQLFHQSAGVPHAGNDAHIFPFLSCYDFPDSCLRRDVLSAALDGKRVAAIRRDVAEKKGAFVSYQAPWNIETANLSAKVDLIVSNSVLEHVDDTDLANTAFKAWIKPSCYMAHLIDFSSHGLFREWNGHYACSALTLAPAPRKADLFDKPHSSFAAQGIIREVSFRCDSGHADPACRWPHSGEL